MSRLTVLQALQTILETQFTRVYVYPDDLTTWIDRPTLPFITLEEIPAVDNNTQIWAADWIDVSWFISVCGYTYKGEVAWATAKDTVAKATAFAGRDTVRTLLEANTTLGGTTKPIGTENITYTDFLTPLPWNGEAYYGWYFSIPVTSG